MTDDEIDAYLADQGCRLRSPGSLTLAFRLGQQHAAAQLADANKTISALVKELWPHYWSTYCIHDLHSDCRLACKTCQSPCRCPCHTEET